MLPGERPKPIPEPRRLVVPQHADVLAECEPWRSRELPTAAAAQGCQCSQTAEGMTSSTHDPADCELAVCDRCDSYGDGYSAGKDAAYFALGSSELTQTAAGSLAIGGKVLLTPPQGLRLQAMPETDWAALLEPIRQATGVR